MAVVIDDRLLLDVLAGRRREHHGGAGRRRCVLHRFLVHRLGQALVEGSGSGALSGRFTSLDAEVAE